MSDMPDLKKESKNVRLAIKNIIHAHSMYEKEMVKEERDRFKELLDIILEKWSI